MCNTTEEFSADQICIIGSVKRKYRELTQHKGESEPYIVNADMVSDLMGRLKTNTSHGCDGITAEHLVYSKSQVLLDRLAGLYSAIFIYSIVPEVLLTCIIVPILKKSTLNPNSAENYRPNMLSSVHAKHVELFMIPEGNISDTQLGFRKGWSASFGCAFLHDVILYNNSIGIHQYIYVRSMLKNV